MINVLIVDDDKSKVKKIADVVADALGRKNSNISEVGSASEAAKALEITRFDLMILDLNLPIKVDETPRSDGGMRLLRQIIRGGPRLQRPTHIVGLTAFDELLSQYHDEVSKEAWHLVKFDASSEEWANAIANKAVYIAESKVTTIEHNFDLGIVTALRGIELDAILDLPGSWEEEQIRGDTTFYYVGTFERNDREVSVVAASANEMGMPAASCLSMKVIHNYRPKYLAMAGITAGVDANFGDIVVAEQSWDYGSGKVYTTDEARSSFAPAPSYLNIDSGLREQVRHFVGHKAELIAGIPVRWKGNPVSTALSVRLGPMASGAAVVECEEVIADIKAHNRKVVAVEMETYGVYLAARVCSEPRPAAFSVKSVCDFGVPPKTDEYQRYAAFTSAQFIYEFTLEQLSVVRSTA